MSCSWSMPSPGYDSTPYRGEADYCRMLQLHRDISQIASGPICCTAGELEWWRFQEKDPDGEIASAHLWETGGGTLVAYAWPGPDYMNMIVHPGHRGLTEPILAWAEDRQGSRPDGPEELTTEAVDADEVHVAALERRGYARTDQSRECRQRSLEIGLPDFGLPTGYAIRDVVSRDDVQNREALAEHRYAAHLVRAPTYRTDLNLAVVAPDGRFAAFCTLWLDEQNRVGVFEPVECLPQFRRRGLTRAMMREGMRRLAGLGAVAAYIVNRTHNIPAKRLYESLGFQQTGCISEWKLSLRR